ncbi:hypothetical protein F4777DRAFT_563624 [Nemania sp. FL0916]|nr:hypothetical protein F4777DRAFT_563624 [Nemania sp. FL0916]
MASLRNNSPGCETGISNSPADAVTQSTESPQIDIQVSFDRPTHSYSQLEPPRIFITVTSRARYPITVYTWRRPLDPKRALISNGYIVTDQATGDPVRTTYLMINRMPELRVRGSPDDKYILTLQPNTPVELSTGFGRAGGGIKPDPRAIVERGWERDEHGNEQKIRRSMQATGVDGLEPGHTYSVGLNMESLRGMWWAPVTRDEILVDHRGKGSYIQEYPWNVDRPLDFRVAEAQIQILD